MTIIYHQILLSTSLRCVLNLFLYYFPTISSLFSVFFTIVKTRGGEGGAFWGQISAVLTFYFILNPPSPWNSVIFILERTKTTLFQSPLQKIRQATLICRQEEMKEWRKTLKYTCKRALLATRWTFWGT